MFALSVILMLTAVQAPRPAHGEPLRDASLFGRATKFPNCRLDKLDEYVWLDNHSILVGVEGKTKPIQFSFYKEGSHDKVSRKNLNKTMTALWDSYLYEWHLSPDKSRLLLVFRNQGYG